MTDQELTTVILIGGALALYMWVSAFLYISVRIKEDTLGAENRVHPVVLAVKCLMWPTVLFYASAKEAAISYRNKQILDGKHQKTDENTTENSRK